MSSAEQHSVIVERRGTAHRACCACGWSGHSWNELRPAEADAWHHTFGADRIVDFQPGATEGGSAVAAAVASALSGAAGAGTGAGAEAGAGAAGVGSVERVVETARAQARGTSPHNPAGIGELVRVAAASPEVITGAQDRIGQLLRRHSQRNAGAADDEWLELHTARRLLDAALAEVSAGAELA